MIGALYHKKIGHLEIGAYINTEGCPRLVMRGECSPTNLDAIIAQLKAVKICIENADHTKELTRTGVMHNVA